MTLLQQNTSLLIRHNWGTKIRKYFPAMNVLTKKEHVFNGTKMRLELLNCHYCSTVTFIVNFRV